MCVFVLVGDFLLYYPYHMYPHRYNYCSLQKQLTRLKTAVLLYTVVCFRIIFGSAFSVSNLLSHISLAQLSTDGASLLRRDPLTLLALCPMLPHSFGGLPTMKRFRINVYKRGKEKDESVKTDCVCSSTVLLFALPSLGAG